MPLSVSDTSSNRQEKIANAVRVIGRSKDRLAVFSAIYYKKQQIKTVSWILLHSGLKNRKRVLTEAKKLADEDIVIQLLEKVDGETAYQKLGFYYKNKNKIISLIKNKKSFHKFPTRENPQIKSGTIVVKYPQNLVRIKQVSVDNFDSFSKVKRMKMDGGVVLYESQIKNRLKKIIREKGEFQDWGGETDDLYSTRIKLNGKRISVALALKGKATTGILTPKKMGTNGDQIQRLFKSPAEVFLIQYGAQIAESVIDQMKTYAISKSVTENQRVYYGVIDGQDTKRLLHAYPE